MIVISVLLCASSCELAEIRVWDGDSMRLGERHQSEAIRLMNIGAPEIEGRCAFETGLARRAKVRLAEILEGQRVVLHRQGTDRYGRVLAAVFVNGVDAGNWLVSEGLASCLILWFDGAILSMEWKEALWDKFVTEAPRPRTPSEQQYNHRKLRSRN